MLASAESKTFYTLQKEGKYIGSSEDWWESVDRADLRGYPRYWEKYLEEKPIKGARIVSVTETTIVVVLPA